MANDITAYSIKKERRQKQVKEAVSASKIIALIMLGIVIYGIGAGFTFRKWEQWYPNDVERDYDDGRIAMSALWPLTLPILTGVHFANPAGPERR